jgi:hypothetical protein
LKGYCIALAKPRKQTLFTSFYNNIINHETKECFLKYLFHAHYMIPDILTQENEGIAKFFTLMLKDYLNKVMELNAIIASSWDICIHLETWKGIA